MHCPSYWSSEACAARAARFGKFLVLWRTRNGWSQYEVPKWSDSAGFIGPAIGTVSQLERGRVSTPTMALFAGLAEVNRRLFERDFSGVTSRRLMDRLQEGIPVVDRAGVPWGFHEFVSAFHLPDQVDGELWEASGSSNRPQPELTPEEIARVNSTLQEGFQALAEKVRPRSRALNVAGKVAPAGPHREAFEDALSGVGYDAATLLPLWDAEAGEWSPLVWWGQLRQDRPDQA